MRTHFAHSKISVLKFSFILISIISIGYIAESRDTAAAKAVQSISAAAYKPVKSPAPLKNPFLACRSGQKNSPADTVNAYSSVPALRGIITHNNRNIGIFEYAGQSTYHTAGELLGPYTITSLTEHTAVLSNSKQQITLQLER